MSEPVELSGIRFTDSMIANIQDNRVYCSVNRSDIISLAFKWGILSQRTVIQIIFGSIVSLFGFYAIRFVYEWLIRGGTAFDYQIMLTLLFPIGIWLILDSLKKGYYLELSHKSGTRKMTFQKKQELKTIEDFAVKLKEQLNYDIRVCSETH